MLRITRIGDHAGLRLVGEIDLACADELSGALDEAVRAGGDVTLDVAGVEFMDSSGLHMLLRAARDLQGKGNLVLRHPSEAVRRLLDLTGVADQVPNLVLVDSGLA